MCEEALVLSDKREVLQNILANTLGVIFMGTPHGGSYLADWGDRVAKYVNLFRGVNRDILRNLHPGSADLERVGEDFENMIRRKDVKLSIFCFYEELKINDAVGKIVESPSAILNGYGNCSIHADYRNMTKFSGRSDAGYGHICGKLSRWIADAQGKSPTHGEGCQKTDTMERTERKERVTGDINFHGSFSGQNVIAGMKGDTVNLSFN